MSSVIAYRAGASGLERLPVEAATLDEATLLTGHGTYSVFRLYQGKRVLRLGHHLARMRSSAASIGHRCLHTDDWLRNMLRLAVEDAGYPTPRVRLTVPYSAPDTAIIALEPFTPPAPELLGRGVAVAVVSTHRDHPSVKDSRFIEVRRELYASHSGVYEVLLSDDDGRLLEGTGSNFYGVLDGRLYTAAAGMLEGIARRLLLEVAEGIIDVVQEAVTIHDVPRLSEAMLTSASRGIIPVVSIDGQAVGDGLPGSITKRLSGAFDAAVEAELENL